MFMKKLQELSLGTGMVTMTSLEEVLQDFDVVPKTTLSIAGFPVCNDNTDHWVIGKEDTGLFIIRVSDSVMSNYCDLSDLDQDFTLDTNYTVEDGADDASGCFILLRKQEK